MGPHPVVGPIGYRVGPWRIYGTGSGELLSGVATMTVGVRVGIVVVGLVEARRPSRDGLHSRVCDVVYPTDEGRALHLRDSVINVGRSVTGGDPTRAEPYWPPYRLGRNSGSQPPHQLWRRPRIYFQRSRCRAIPSVSWHWAG